MRYDLIIVGADEAGIEAAIAADEMLLRVAIIAPVATTELKEALALHCVDLFCGEARFVNSQEVAIRNSQKTMHLQAEAFIIATGCRSARPAHIPFDGTSILDVDEMRQLNLRPQSLTLIGGDSAGMDLAMEAARHGTKVTILDSQDQGSEGEKIPNPAQISAEAQHLGIEYRSNEQVIGIEKTGPTESTVLLANGQRITSEIVLVSGGCVGNTEALNLDGIGVETDERGRLWCNDDQQTWVDNVYGVGDVVGYPLPPQLPAEQGRHAVMHALGHRIGGCQATFKQPLSVPQRYESPQATAL